jgi:hypothetical protein
MTGEQNIELFAGYALSGGEARALILAYSGADRIREWRCLGHARANVAMPTRTPAPAVACYASVIPTAGCQQAGHAPAPVLGRGATPEAAVEDLLWRIVGPRLLVDGRH